MDKTIEQTGIYGKHVLASYQFPDHYDHPDVIWHGHKMISEALNASMNKRGPVHINVPMREPFYPEDKLPMASRELRVIHQPPSSYDLLPSELQGLKHELNQFDRVLIVAGQSQLNLDTASIIDHFSTQNEIPVVSDVISNHCHLTNSILHQDLFLGLISEERKAELKPDLLISFGSSVISKNLKLFLRKYKPEAHWHFEDTDVITPDPFQSLTRSIKMDFSKWSEIMNQIESKPSEYLEAWRQLDRSAHSVIESILPSEYWELTTVNSLIQSLPENAKLHLGNSMPVRWANFVNHNRKDIEVFSNRGTSGIDGCLSTAVGNALTTKDTLVALMGDMSFLYDRNGLWHNYIPDNLRIVVLNNHGGGIFRLIEGPSNQPELDEFFETEQRLTARYAAKEHNLSYIEVASKEALKEALPAFLNTGKKCGIMEIMTDSKVNKGQLSQLKNEIAKSLNMTASS